MTAVPASLTGFSGLRLRLIIAALTFLAAAPLLLAWTMATSDRPTTAVVWGGLALAVLAFGLLYLVGGAVHHDLGLSRWKIGSLMLVWYALAYGVATVTWSHPQTGVTTEIYLPSVLRALWLVAVGITAWSAGYLIGPGMPSASRLGQCGPLADGSATRYAARPCPGSCMPSASQPVSTTSPPPGCSGTSATYPPRSPPRAVSEGFSVRSANALLWESRWRLCGYLSSADGMAG